MTNTTNIRKNIDRYQLKAEARPRESETGYSEARRNVERSDFDKYSQFESKELKWERNMVTSMRSENYVEDHRSEEGFKKAGDLDKLKFDGAHSGMFDETPQGEAFHRETLPRSLVNQNFLVVP